MVAGHAASGLRFLDFLSPWDKPRFVLDAEDRMRAIRKPPKPPGWHASKGVCRFCAGEIWEDSGSRLVLKTAKCWHDWPEHPCRHLWAIANDPGYARMQVFLRDHGVCSYCAADTKVRKPDGWASWEDVLADIREIGPSSLPPALPGLGAWDTEHEIPLWLVDRDASDALKFWLMGNLKTACHRCHSEKTAREAGQRAKIKRIAEAGALLLKKKNERERRLN